MYKVEIGEWVSRRLHKRPNAHEIERCRWWLQQERRIIKPAVTVALGATAARSLLGRPVGVGQARGQVIALDRGRDDPPVMAAADTRGG